VGTPRAPSPAHMSVLSLDSPRVVLVRIDLPNSLLTPCNLPTQPLRELREVFLHSFPAPISHIAPAKKCRAIVWCQSNQGPQPPSKLRPCFPVWWTLTLIFAPKLFNQFPGYPDGPTEPGFFSLWRLLVFRPRQKAHPAPPSVMSGTPRNGLSTPHQRPSSTDHPPTDPLATFNNSTNRACLIFSWCAFFHLELHAAQHVFDGRFLRAFLSWLNTGISLYVLVWPRTRWQCLLPLSFFSSPLPLS